MPEFSCIFHWNLPAGQYSSQPWCKVAETVEHFSFDCDRYAGGRKKLEESVENILAREGMNCGTIYESFVREHGRVKQGCQV